MFYNYVYVAYKIDMVARKTIVVTINATRVYYEVVAFEPNALDMKERQHFTVF